jgi:spermidine synthase
MNQRAFLLGLFSIGGQTLLLREIVASLNGDELFIGAALFGWLLAVGAGSIIGGLSRFKPNPFGLFATGAILLPISIIAVRLSPLIFGLSVGQIFPFSSAFLIAFLFMAPVGIIGGALFSAVAREGHRPAESIALVYLWEGLGAFVGGILTVALVGWFYSNLTMSILLSLVIITFYLAPPRKTKLALPGGILIASAVALKFAVPQLDARLDELKYKSYRVVASFDARQGRQTILFCDGAYSLLTDNTVEGTYPDLITAENLLLPALIYRPQSRNILYVGRPEFGLTQLADSFPNIKITSLDPRWELSKKLDEILPLSPNINRIEADPLAFLMRTEIISKYDIIIVNAGQPNCYKNSRFISDKFLAVALRALNDDGIFFYPTDYDADRYIADEKKVILAAINNTLKKTFIHAAAWPGESTLFFASKNNKFDLPRDSIYARADAFTYRPQYINIDYLENRLQELKRERLRSAMNSSAESNSLNKPVLTLKQAVYRSGTSPIDKQIAPIFFSRPLWITVSLAVMATFLLTTVIPKNRRRLYGLFLFFVAGFVSLTLELISFYIYQSTAGSLYSEMALLIASFMMGLALGTYVSIKVGADRLELPALLLLLATVVILWATYENIPAGASLSYYVFCLLCVASGTGSLFVAASRKFYFGRPQNNRGLGYAVELAGSSFGALAPSIILLPLFGLQVLLAAITILLLISLAAAVLAG